MRVKPPRDTMSATQQVVLGVRLCGGLRQYLAPFLTPGSVDGRDEDVTPSAHARRRVGRPFRRAFSGWLARAISAFESRRLLNGRARMSSRRETVDGDGSAMSSGRAGMGATSRGRIGVAMNAREWGISLRGQPLALDARVRAPALAAAPASIRLSALASRPLTGLQHLFRPGRDQTERLDRGAGLVPHKLALKAFPTQTTPRMRVARIARLVAAFFLCCLCIPPTHEAPTCS